MNFIFALTLKAQSYLSFYILRKCPYSELFWSAFSRIRTEYEEILRISPYSVRVRENADQNNFGYGPFLRSTSRLTGKLFSTDTITTYAKAATTIGVLCA